MIQMREEKSKKKGGSRNWKRIIAISLIIILASSLLISGAYAFAFGGQLFWDAVGTTVGVYSGVAEGVSEWGDIDVQGQTDEQVADTIYNNLQTDESVYDSARVSQRTGLNRSDETALSYAKIEVVQSLEEGENLSTALKEGRSAIDEFYVNEQQMAVINTWNNNVLASVCTARDAKMKSIQQTGSWDTNDTLRFVFEPTDTSDREFYYLEPSNELDAPAPATNEYNAGYITNQTCQDGGMTQQVELLDGSKVDVNVLQLRNTVDSETINYTIVNQSQSGLDSSSTNPKAQFKFQDASTAYPEDTQSSWKYLYDGTKWHSQIVDEIHQKHSYAIDQLGNETSGFVYEVYQAYEQGDLENASDLLSVYDIHRQSTGQYNTTEWATLQLNAQDIPTAFDTQVTVETGDGRNLTGEFYTQAQPWTDGWQVGTQYGENISEPVFIVGQSSTATIGTGTTFTITDATKNNESISNFTSSDVGMADATADNILEKIDLQNEKMDELTESGLGGGSLIPEGSLLLYLVAGLFVIIVGIRVMDDDRSR